MLEKMLVFSCSVPFTETVILDRNYVEEVVIFDCAMWIEKIIIWMKGCYNRGKLYIRDNT